MPKCMIIVPFENGSAQFPDIDQTKYPISFVCGNYVPPIKGTPQYVLVTLSAPQIVIDILTARTDCLYVCAIVEDTDYEKVDTTVAQRNGIRTKISNMGFTGSQFGLLNAAIQSSKNRSELAKVLATKAFFRNLNKDFMNEDDLNGCQIGSNEKVLVVEKETK